MWYVYIDWTTEVLPRPFYVGMGKDARISSYTRNNLHTNIKQKYGIVREITMVTTVEQFARNREIALIAKHKTNMCRADEGHWGANFTDGGDGVSGWHHTKENRMLIKHNTRLAVTDNTETSRKNGFAHRAENLSGHTRELQRNEQLGKIDTKEKGERRSRAMKGKGVTPVLQFSLANEFIAKYASITEARRAVPSANSNISACCLGMRSQAGGFLWRYASNKPKELCARDHKIIELLLTTQMIANEVAVLLQTTPKTVYAVWGKYRRLKSTK